MHARVTTPSPGRRIWSGVLALLLAVGYVGFVATPFWFAALAGPGWGAVVGVLFAAVWLRTMPSGCLNGAFLFGLLMTQQLALLLGWAITGLLVMCGWVGVD